jgi:hypothetical protein
MSYVKPLISQTFFTDGGHGWLKVTKTRLEKLGIADKISSCSFMRGSYAYLEEDCDFSVYIMALLKQENIGERTETTDEYGTFMRLFWNRTKSQDSSNSKSGSRIRNYSSYVFYTEADLQEKEDLLILLLGDRQWNKTGVRRINNGSLEDLRYWKKYYNL